MKSRAMHFSQKNHEAFARLSGDHNPVHVDRAAARRIAVGEPIIHGMHVVLRTLNEHFGAASAPFDLEVRFARPIVVGDTVIVWRTSPSAIALTLEGTLPLATISVLKAAEARKKTTLPSDPSRASRAPGRPRVRTLQDIEGAAGVMALASPTASARRFASATRAIGADAVGTLAGISQLIGMECPGRDSLLSALSLRIDRADITGHLHWRVARVDSRFGLVRMEVRGDGVSGTVDVFIRPAPLPSPPFAAVAAKVRPGEFEGQRALIVGGSRGLGAATAMLVAAGGGESLVTFAAGKAAANAIRRDAARSGRRIATMPFDVVLDPPKALARACKRFRPTHLYYFATPRIFARRHDPYDAARFRTFSDFYVSGFAAVCRAAMESVSLLHVLFPSTTALDGEPVRELTEYASAKAAGEVVGRALSESIPGLTVVVRRLPRAATDQTASILPAPAADPIAVMLPIVREMHSDWVSAR